MVYGRGRGIDASLLEWRGLYRKGEGLWLWGERLGGFDEFVQVLKN